MAWPAPNPIPSFTSCPNPGFSMGGWWTTIGGEGRVDKAGTFEIGFDDCVLERGMSLYIRECGFQFLNLVPKLNFTCIYRKVEMEAELRSLIGKYGMKAVHEGLMKEMEDTFSYLKNIFQGKNEIVVPVHHHSVPTVEVVNNTIPEHILHEDHIQDDLFDNDSLAEPAAQMPADPTIKHIVLSDSKSKAVKSTPIVKPATDSAPAHVPVVAKPSPATVIVKQPKQQHREEVEKKRQELVAKGVKPESLLTEENLRKWLGQGMSYQKIAKETGVHEVQVSNVAKTFGLQSSISRYVAMKKGK